MEIACLDLEGVLIPEIWINFAEKTGIEELKATTRDIPDYDVLMKHEHVNNAQEIEDVLKYFFNDVGCRIFGISRNLAFYRFYACRKPDKDKCRAYLRPGEI